MQVDYLAGRLDRLKLTSHQVAALAEVRNLRLALLSQVSYKTVANDEIITQILELYKKKQTPFQNWELLQKLNWKKCSDLIVRLVRELLKAGLKNGSAQALVKALESNGAFAFELCKAALDSKQGGFFALAAKYDVEPDLLRFIVLTPLVPVLNRTLEVLPLEDKPVPITRCPLCGAQYSNGVYQSGYRYVICPVCNHRVRVDPFFCPRCGNTQPDLMGFAKFEQEPVVQIDYCLKCGSYFKMAREELMASTVTDAVLLDLSTMDLDSLGRELVLKGTKPTAA